MHKKRPAKINIRIEIDANVMEMWASITIPKDMQLTGEYVIEWVWKNYPHPVELHDYQFGDDNFRKIEQIKNKTKKCVTRLLKIYILERQALLTATNSVYYND